MMQASEASLRDEDKTTLGVVGVEPLHVPNQHRETGWQETSACANLDVAILNVCSWASASAFGDRQLFFESNEKWSASKHNAVGAHPKVHLRDPHFGVFYFKTHV